MSINNKTYSLSNMKQLIDLNGDVTNFDLTFTATSQDGSPFYALVVDQTTLDSNPSLEYKKAEGTISGNIISDKGVYQNYFLILKSDNPCKCNVSIQLKEIPQSSSSQPQLETREKFKSSASSKKTSKSSSNWFLILVIVVVCCAVLWWFYGKKKKNSSESSLLDTTKSLTSSPKLTESVPSIEPPSTVVEDTINLDLGNKSSNVPNNSLMDRLSKLKINLT